MPTLYSYTQLLWMAARQWWGDKVPRLGAALAFYSVLSLGPLLLIAVGIAGSVFGADRAREEILYQIGGMIGDTGRAAIDAVFDNARDEEEGIIATLIGVTTLLIAAAGVFGELQDALNGIWRVPTKQSRGLLHWFARRFLSFTMVLGTGFLLLISLIITATMNIVGDLVSVRFSDLTVLIEAVNFVLSFVITALLFATIFKLLPDRPVRWHDVWPGAITSAALFSIGKFAIGLYIGHAAIVSSYGAAGSLVVILIWVYYSAQILYFGAELSKVVTARREPELLT